MGSIGAPFQREAGGRFELSTSMYFQNVLLCTAGRR